MSQVYLLVREAHGCIKQRSIFLVAQGAGRAARISFLATTRKHAPLMRPQGHCLPMCFANKQLLTTSLSCCCFCSACDTSYVRLAGELGPIIWHALRCRKAFLADFTAPCGSLLLLAIQSARMCERKAETLLLGNTRYPSGCSIWSSIHFCWSNSTGLKPSKFLVCATTGRL